MAIRKGLGSRKRKSSVLDEVRRELKEESDEELDEEYDAGKDSGNLGSLLDFGRKPRHPDEIAIDEMLMGLDGNDWYLKLSKETSPNTWQFKRRIDKFRHWADLELEINKLVQAETAAEVKRRGKVISWGSGRYMVSFFSDNGLRGSKRKPIFFDIDAQEPDALPPTAQQNEALDLLRETIASPKEVIQQNVESMQKGMELAAMAGAKSSGMDNSMLQLMMTQSNNQTQMMVGLMTAIVGAISGKNGGDKDPIQALGDMLAVQKNMGLLPAPVDQGKSLTDQIFLFKTLGLIKEPGDNDPLSMLNKMKGVFGILQELTGAGPAERPGIMEKLIDAVGPHVGKLLGAIENVSAMKTEQLKKDTVTAMSGANRPIIVQAPKLPAMSSMPMQAPSVPVQAPMSSPLNAQGFPARPYEEEQEDIYAISYPDMPDLPPESYQQAAAEKTVASITPEQMQRAETEPMRVQTAQVAQTNTGGQADMGALAAELRQAVTTRDYSAFGRITEQLDIYFGTGVVKQRIQVGQMTAKDLTNYVMLFDPKSYQSKEAYLGLQDYAYRYVEAIQKESGAVDKKVLAKCSTCQAVHEFDNIEQWQDEAGENGGVVVCGVNNCTGSLELMMENVVAK